MHRIYAVLDPWSHVLRNVLDLATAWRLFREHQAGEDRSDLLVRWLVQSCRCLEAEPA